MKVQVRRVALVLAVSLVFGLIGCDRLQPIFSKRPTEKMPAFHPVAEMYYADQNWSAYQREWFYHTTQGTELMPFPWFMALEQANLRPFGTVPKFHESSYLVRFGFFPDQSSVENPEGLPVGFARDTVTDPETGETVDVVGLSCAACHTGQLEYKGKGIRIDGGSGTVDLASFQTELGYAAAYTEYIPWRFDRFAEAVLGKDASSEAKDKLHTQFKAFLKRGLAEKNAADAAKLYGAAGGFGRTDALGRIGNFVFGTELDNQNLRVADAPVNFPPLWYTSWFSWVQYNGSIQQPMVRNIGEALGVRARVNLTDQAKLFQSTVNVKNLHAMENLLAGPSAFKGLHSPPWPEQILGAIDRNKAERGAELYKKHCQHCHLPPVNSPEFQDAKYWEDGLGGRKFVKLNLIPLDEIGTDPRAATNWQQRKAVTNGLGLGTVSAADGLRLVTRKIAELKYNELSLPLDQRAEWNGYRDEAVAAPLAYRARPLGGIWATPPFLHNGSVPNLYQLLSPVEKRDKYFFLGSREFDPKYVGYATTPFDGAFEYFTDQPGAPHPGNSNAGHEFRNERRPGVIGPELSEQERWDLIEYLKTL